MNAIEIQNVRKTYKTAQGTAQVFNKLSLTLPSGQIVLVLGHNGRGKTTLLRLVAGFIVPDEGSIVQQDGTCMQTCGIGYVDQNFRQSLFPWLTVRSNILLARNDVDAVDQVLTTLNIVSLRDRYVFELSGGQAQLTAIARALVAPGPLLLDEPFSALDVDRSKCVAALLHERVTTSGRNCILATHDIELGLLTAHTVVVLPNNATDIPTSFVIPKNIRSDHEVLVKVRSDVVSLMFAK